MILRIFLISVLIFPVSALAINIPLTIQEPLPTNIEGLNRTSEVSTGGIPLPEDSGITSVDQLGLSGASVGQFRALGEWPNGNIKWVLVDTVASITAETTNTSISLVNGSGNFGGSDLATDNTTYITVATGSATFTIKKASFNVFDTVTVGSTALVSTGNAGKISMIGKDDTVYTSSNDSSSTATIEENGPVRAVIKSTGALKSSGGTRHIDYTLRLHFYKNKSYVKGVIELRNASKTNAYLTRDFKSVEVIVPLGLTGSKSVTFGINGTPETESLSSSATAYLMQGYTTPAQECPAYVFVSQAYYWQPPLPGTGSGSSSYTYDSNYRGVKAVVGSTTVNSFGTQADRSDSYGYITDSGTKGAVLLYKSLADFWPGGLEFKDSGSTSIELYSKQNPYNSTNPIKLGFGQHDTREIMWSFFDGSASATEAKYALEFPLVIRAALSHYADTKAIYGQSEFVTPTEQSTIYSTLSTSSPKATSPLASNYADVYVFRGWPWEQGGGWNQNNHAGNDLLDFIRTGGGGYYLKAASRERMIMDSALGRSDDYSTETFSIDSEEQMWPRLLTSGGADGEHTYLYSLPLYYYMTGNESAKEAWLDYGDRLLRNEANSYYQMPDSPWLRGISNTIRNAAIVYEFSCEQGSCNNDLKTELEGAAAFQIDSRGSAVYGASGRGRDMNRGFIYWDTDVTYNGAEKRVTHSIYHNHIHFEAMYQLWRVMSSDFWGYSRLQELEDYMTGLARFYLDEWIEAPPGGDTLAGSPYFYPYAQHYDYLLDEQPTYVSNGNLVPYSFGRASVWAFQHTGDESYLTKGAHMVWEQTHYSGDSVRNASELQDQAVMWSYLNQNDIDVWEDLPISVTDNGGGSYTLSWSVPEGAKEYQIKYSSKPIVEWLGFNQDTRAYQYNPANYTPYFAATNIDDTPEPSGSTQEITVTGLPNDLEWDAMALIDTNLPHSLGTVLLGQ